jgi:nucleoside-diphosphate-sugar epimerase
LKKRIIIFGGSGFIGVNLIRALSKKNFNITSVSRKLPLRINRIKNVKYVNCDVSKLKDLKKINTNYDFVFNFSGNIDHKNKNQTLKTHYLGCKNILEIFKKKKFKLFIQLGSSLEYGDLSSPHSENTRTYPKSVYGKAKLKATKFIFNYNKKNKINFIILRLYQVYGAYQKFDRLIPFIVRNSINNKKFECTDGRQFRDFLHVNDLVSLFLKILKKKKIRNGIYNVGTGKPLQVKKIINIISKTVKKGEPLFGKIKMRNDENLRYYPNILKIKRFFNWKSKIDIISGLKKTIKFYEK